MTTLHLIRHGQTDWNAERRCQGQSESQLNDTGKQQAETRRSDIEALGITAIYSSPSIRTRQTTAILAGKLELEVNWLDDLREIFLGPWETRLWDEIMREEPETTDDFLNFPQNFSRTDTESYYELRDRGVGAMESIFAKEPAGSQVLVVSHGALLKSMLTHYAKVGIENLPEIPPLDNCSHSVLQAGSAESANRTLVSIAGTPLEKTVWSGQALASDPMCSSSDLN